MIFPAALAWCLVIPSSLCAIVIPALGNTVDVGTLYDVRTGQFHLQVFKDDLPENSVKMSDSPKMTSETKIISRLEQKCNLISLDASITVSVLSGLIGVSGSGGYLNENLNTRKHIEVTHYTSLLTKKEELQPLHNMIKSMYSIETLRTTTATHMVTGIDWGASVVATFTYAKDDHLSAQEVTGAFKVNADLKIITVDGEAKINFSGNDSLLNESTSVKIHADLPMPNHGVPQTVSEVKEYIASIPTLLQLSNEGKGKPMLYHLTPLTELRGHLGVDIQEKAFNEKMSEAMFKNCIEFFQKINDIDNKIRQYETVFEMEYVPDTYCSKLEQLKFRFNIAVGDYKKKVQDLVISTRSNVSESNEGLVDTEENVKSIMAELVFPDLKFKQFVYHIFMEDGIDYIGKHSLFESTLLRSNNFLCFLLPKSDNNSKHEDFYTRILEFKMASTHKRVALDCEFSSPVCSKYDVSKGIILEYYAASVVDSDFRFPLPQEFADDVVNNATDIDKDNIPPRPNAGRKEGSVRKSGRHERKLRQIRKLIRQIADRQFRLELKFTKASEATCQNDGVVQMMLFDGFNLTGSNETIHFFPRKDNICCKNLGGLDNKAKSGYFVVSAACVTLYDLGDCTGQGKSFFPSEDEGFVRRINDFEAYNERFSSAKICATE